jgi:hypothetical protein
MRPARAGEDDEGQGQQLDTGADDLHDEVGPLLPVTVAGRCGDASAPVARGGATWSRYAALTIVMLK